MNLRSPHLFAASARPPPPILAGFPQDPNFPDAGHGALALNRDIATEVSSRKQVCNAQDCLMKSGFMLNSHPFQTQSTLKSMSMWIVLCLLDSVAVTLLDKTFISS